MNNYIKKIYENNDMKKIDKLANNINDSIYDSSEQNAIQSSQSLITNSSINSSDSFFNFNIKNNLIGGNNSDQIKFITFYLIGIIIIIFIDTCTSVI